MIPNGDLDIQAVQEFVAKSPEHPVVRGMRKEIMACLADLESVRNISPDGDIAIQALGKQYALVRLEELFDHLGFGVKISPSQKPQSFR